MKHFKKTALLIFAFFSFFANAQQESVNDNEETNKTISILKLKLGMSTIKINELEKIEGNVFQFDMMFSNKISKSFLIEYGTRFSNFRANYSTIEGHKYIDCQTLGVPLNVVFSKDLNSVISLSHGLGIYGNYLYNAKIGSEIDKENVGFNFGLGIQTGAVFKVSESTSFGIMIDIQGDLNKISKDDLKVKQANTSLISLNFNHKI